MARNPSRRRPRRRSSAPNVPAPGASASRGPRQRKPPPAGAVGPAATMPALDDANLSETYAHVRHDLFRILVLAVIMFILIYGAKVAADIYGSSFVLDLIR